ncbi:MAG: RNA polymerase sigma-70 factor [Mariniphaga sp.]|nr:RNA polymerase sigma-70 factor [Mariniphaga sp.]MDD4227148.1 RNA polymerase sigma-70 factor [Mariniphaga sp.]MDD4424577.1 RNA polymerase sigma-70 factor [Mariniphaga sp.]
MTKNKRNEEEQFIFRRMVEGDKEAFRFFFEKYYTELCNLVNLYIHNEIIAEEIVQDIYIYLWEKKGNIHIESSIRAYLLKASKNKSLNYLRNEKIKLNIQDKIHEVANSTYEMPSNLLDERQLREIIENAVKNLSERCREIYRLSKENDLSYKEIAEKMGISVKTVENHMGIALRKLRNQLRPYYNDIFLLILFWMIQ